MLKKVFLSSVLFLISLLAATQLMAQTESQVDTERSLLPDIDPQDIEIRSQFQARFPGLSRQPILGFNPRPRVYQIDPDRTPFIEDEETVLASLPIGQLDRLESPEYNPLGYAPPKYAFIRAGIGSDITPEADIFAVGRINEGSWISGNIRHHSSGGHDELVNTSYRNLNAVIRSYNRLSENARLKLDAGVSSKFNHQLSTISADSAFAGFNSRTELLGFQGGAKLEVSNTSLTGVDAYIRGYGNDFSLTSELPAFDGNNATNWAISAGGEYSRLGPNINEIYKIKINTDFGQESPVNSAYQSWSTTTLAGVYERLFNYRTDVRASVGVSGATDIENDFKVYFSPEVEIMHTFFRGLNFRGLAYGKPSYSSFGDIYSENRFYDFGNYGIHQYEMAALAEIQLEPFIGTKISGGVSYKNISDKLYFSRRVEPMGIGEIERGYYETKFDNAYNFAIFGGVTQDLKPEVIWISANASLQEHELSDVGGNIPYTETFSVSSTLSFKPVNELLIEGWGEFKSGRENELGESLSSFVTIGSRFEFSLGEKFGIYGKILNIIDEEYEYWDGFQEHGFRGFVGITILL